jgi:uncharacterized zinc-type alcohol dehydrogenase-like protein
MNQIAAWVATAAKQKLVRQQIDLGALGDEEVEVRVEHCGLCHSDLSMLANDWGWSRFPAVLGHEAVGTVVAVGRAAKGVEVGQKVGVGWTAESCMHCRRCLSGDHHLCAQAVPTIVGHRGGFASRVRAHWAWAVPLPETLDAPEAGPLLCGGVTVFTPLAAFARPTSRVGVVGIGGLGHLAVKFAAAFGCEVVSKEELFRCADILTIHLVLSQRTKGLVGAAELRAMKPTARLINTSRGPIVHEPALIEVLRERRIAGAALDVFDTEPLPADHPFRSLDNVLAPPHLGFVERELYRTFYGDTVRNIVRWLAFGGDGLQELAKPVHRQVGRADHALLGTSGIPERRGGTARQRSRLRVSEGEE